MTDIVQDREFWIRAQSLVTAWLAASPEKEHRRYWIDDFIPSAMRRTNPAAEVQGIAWLMRQGAGIECTFVTVVPWRVVNGDRRAIEIESLAIDLDRKALEVVLRSNHQNA